MRSRVIVMVRKAIGIVLALFLLSFFGALASAVQDDGQLLQQRSHQQKQVQQHEKQLEKNKQIQKQLALLRNQKAVMLSPDGSEVSVNLPPEAGTTTFCTKGSQTLRPWRVWRTHTFSVTSWSESILGGGENQNHHHHYQEKQHRYHHPVLPDAQDTRFRLHVHHDANSKISALREMWYRITAKGRTSVKLTPYGTSCVTLSLASGVTKSIQAASAAAEAAGTAQIKAQADRRGGRGERGRKQGEKEGVGSLDDKNIVDKNNNNNINNINNINNNNDSKKKGVSHSNGVQVRVTVSLSAASTDPVLATLLLTGTLLILGADKLAQSPLAWRVECAVAGAFGAPLLVPIASVVVTAYALGWFSLLPALVAAPKVFAFILPSSLFSFFSGSTAGRAASGGIIGGGGKIERPLLSYIELWHLERCITYEIWVVLAVLGLALGVWFGHRYPLSRTPYGTACATLFSLVSGTCLLFVGAPHQLAAFAAACAALLLREISLGFVPLRRVLCHAALKLLPTRTIEMLQIQPQPPRLIEGMTALRATLDNTRDALEALRVEARQNGGLKYRRNAMDDYSNSPQAQAQAQAHWLNFLSGGEDVTLEEKRRWLRSMDSQFGPRWEQQKEDEERAGVYPRMHNRFETHERICHVEHPLSAMNAAEREELEALVDSVRGVTGPVTPVRGPVPARVATLLIENASPEQKS